MTKFETVIQSIIRKKAKLQDHLQAINHSFAFAPLNYWLGVTIMKSPMDLLVLQQIMFDKKPDTIIECGTAYGGSAYFMACMMDLMDIDGQVITIDSEPNQAHTYHKKDLIRVNGEVMRLDVQEIKKPNHPKIIYIHSECLAAKLPKLGKKTMVVLDCHHTASHVSQELEKFSPLVTSGQYLIVEDTDAIDLQGGGPRVAVKKFLGMNRNFVADTSREKYGVSSNLGGYLLKL